MRQFGLDPVHRERHQPHAAFRIESLDRLHQADIAFLDEVGMRQAVAQVLTRDRHHQTQVGHHHFACGLEIGVVPDSPTQFGFALRRKHRQPIDGRDVSVQVPDRWQCHRGTACTGGDYRCRIPFGHQISLSLALHAAAHNQD